MSWNLFFSAGMGLTVPTTTRLWNKLFLYCLSYKISMLLNDKSVILPWWHVTRTICHALGNKKSNHRLCNNIVFNPRLLNAKPLTPNFTSMFTHRAEVGILGNITCQSIVTGRCCHDQQQRVPGLLSNGSFPMDEWHEQGEYQKIRRALLSWCCLEQLFKNHRLPGHGHTDLVGMCKVYIFLAVIINQFIQSLYGPASCLKMNHHTTLEFKNDSL